MYQNCVFSVLQHQADETSLDSPATSIQSQSQTQIQPLLHRLQQLTSDFQSAQTQLCLTQEREREANEKVQRWVQTCAFWFNMGKIQHTKAMLNYQSTGQNCEKNRIFKMFLKIYLSLPMFSKSFCLIINNELTMSVNTFKCSSFYSLKKIWQNYKIKYFFCVYNKNKCFLSSKSIC